ncbi:hypothetical protein [Bacillus cereus]|uniref:hypothetical protein n=1 Tax=Bacillus cereus group TaxID=86661 RepID=UPI0018A702A4|nr:hypothetical protein [Bacillus cereus]MBF8118872.1 hypothetical protein [Bacillus cereus]
MGTRNIYKFASHSDVKNSIFIESKYGTSHLIIIIGCILLCLEKNKFIAKKWDIATIITVLERHYEIINVTDKFQHYFFETLLPSQQRGIFNISPSMIEDQEKINIIEIDLIAAKNYCYTSNFNIITHEIFPEFNKFIAEIQNS